MATCARSSCSTTVETSVCMATLAELRDALGALGLSTDTGNLRGEARRNELARRLQHARAGVDVTDSNTPELQKWSLSELRSALDLKHVSTQTPGLKGEARRHALIQRLMNAHNGKDVGEVSSAHDSSGVGSFDDDEDTKSVASFNSYSTAGKFIFYDSPSDRSAASNLKLEATSLMPQLSFTKLGTSESKTSSDSSTEHLERELFTLRDKLHTARREQQQQIQQTLQEAGITITLEQLSLKLKALEGERRRLQQNYFAHELVTSAVLTVELSGNSKQPPLEFIQEDALLLIQKRQAALKQLAERTKEAMRLAKHYGVQDVNQPEQSCAKREKSLLQQIQQIESQLSANSHRSSRSSRAGEVILSGNQLETLARYPSMPSGLVPDEWEKMSLNERQQLHHELRKASSFRIKRDRVILNMSESFRMSKSPSQADKLGMKARFLDKTTRDPKAVIEVYKQALELDGDHVENLGSYALFLCKGSAHSAEAQQCFLRALDIDPAHARNLANYANFLNCICGDFAASEAYYKRALAAAPDDVSTLGGYADLLSSTTQSRDKNLSTARHLLEKSLKVLPFHTKNQLRLAVVLSQLGDHGLAEKSFEKLLDGVNEQTRDKRNEVDDGNSIQSGSRKRLSREEEVSIYEAFADFLHKRGQWTRAKCLYDKALASDPDRKSLLRNFSFFLRDAKHHLPPRTTLP